MTALFDLDKVRATLEGAAPDAIEKAVLTLEAFARRDHAHLEDPHADPNERVWHVKLSDQGGLVVTVYDDEGVLFDELRLYRFGAFIAFDIHYHGPQIPPGFEFLKHAIEAKHRLASVGLAGPQLPVFVHSELVRKAFDLGYFPAVLVKTFPAFGSIIIHGLRVVWSRDLDHLSEPT